MNVYHMIEAHDKGYQGLGFTRDVSGGYLLRLAGQFERDLDAPAPRSLAKEWKPLRVTVLGRRGKRSDFPAFNGIPPAFSGAAVAALRDMLEANGELLPLRCDSGEFWAYNLRTVVPALLRETSDVDWIGSERVLAFSINRADLDAQMLEGKTIFRLPEELRKIYVTDAFVQRVQEHGLAGFEFEKIWSSDSRGSGRRAPKAAGKARAASAKSVSHLPAIERHVEKHIGPVAQVFHELVSDDTHLDLLIVPPAKARGKGTRSPARDHYTIVTAGMSDRPMSVPEDSGDIPRHAELMIALPSDWPGLNPDGTFDLDAMRDERCWWPIHWLKQVARLPEQNQTYIGLGHTIPNGEDAEPFASNTRLGCMLVLPTVLSPGAAEMRVDKETTIHFWALWPIYPEEMRLKLKQGIDPLIDRFDEADLTELVRPDRPNTCAQRRK